MTPPRLARRLIARLAPIALRAALVLDLDELFARRAARDGPAAARRWYWRQALTGSIPLVAARLGRPATRPRVADGRDALHRSGRVLEAWWQDTRCAWRGLRRRGAFATVAVLSLALGIGASTAMVSIVYGVLLRPIALPASGQLVLLGLRMPQFPSFDTLGWFFDNPAAFFAWRDQATSFAGLAAISSSQFTLATSGGPRLVRGAHVSTNFFDVLEAQPALGRLLTPKDEGDTTRPMVITDRLWRSAFGADPGVVGRRVGSPDAAATVIGVLPAAFQVEGAELGPMMAGAQTDYFEALHLVRPEPRRILSDYNYAVVGRIRPGVGRAAAVAELDAILGGFAQVAPLKVALSAEVSPLRDFAVASARENLLLLLSGVLAVLLIVCVNVGGLAVTRVVDERSDWAVRAALGASPARLARQLLTEGMMLSLAGGLVGIAAARASLDAILAAAPAGVPRLTQVRADWRVLGVGLALSIAAGLVTGLVPALRLSRTDPQDCLKATGRTTSDGGTLRSRQTLIAVQAALSTVLLAMAVLFGVSFHRLMGQPVGFNPDGALVADVSLAAYPTDAERDQVLERIATNVGAIPGVAATGLTSHLPLEGETWLDAIRVPGRAVPLTGEPNVNVRFVSPGYFAAMGVPLVAGRDIAVSDRPGGPPATSAATEPDGVVVLSRATGTLLWPGEPPASLLGRALGFEGHTVHVVGIVADTRATLAAAPPAIAYAPFWEQKPARISVVVRGASEAVPLAAPLRAAIWDAAPLAPIAAIRPAGDLASAATAPQRYQLTLLLAFAALALGLASMGVYALVAHSVARRRRELAIRLTLGAHSRDLWRLILAQGLAPVVVGVAAGLVAAIAVGRVIAAMLFEVSPTSPVLLVLVAVVVTAAAGAACLLSARRAIRVDPWSALRAG